MTAESEHTTAVLLTQQAMRELAIIQLNGVPTPVRVRERGPYYTAVEFTTFDDYWGSTIEQALTFVLSKHSE